MLRGHAVEARLYAESPERGFLPATGSVLVYDDGGAPSGPGASPLRLDSGICAGTVVGGHYDPMLAKAVAWAETRDEAVERLDGLLARTVVLGVETNTAFLRSLLADDDVRAGRLDTGLIDRLVGSVPGSGSVTGPDEGPGVRTFVGPSPRQPCSSPSMRLWLVLGRDGAQPHARRGNGGRDGDPWRVGTGGGSTGTRQRGGFCSSTPAGARTRCGCPGWWGHRRARAGTRRRCVARLDDPRGAGVARPRPRGRRRVVAHGGRRPRARAAGPRRACRRRRARDGVGVARRADRRPGRPGPGAARRTGAGRPPSGPGRRARRDRPRGARRDARHGRVGRRGRRARHHRGRPRHGRGHEDGAPAPRPARRRRRRARAPRRPRAPGPGGRRRPPHDSGAAQPAAPVPQPDTQGAS